MKLEIELTEEDWKRIVAARRYEVGTEFTDKEIKESIETDLYNILLLEWYPKL